MVKSSYLSHSQRVRSNSFPSANVEPKKKEQKALDLNAKKEKEKGILTQAAKAHRPGVNETRFLSSDGWLRRRPGNVSTYHGTAIKNYTSAYSAEGARMNAALREGNPSSIQQYQQNKITAVLDDLLEQGAGERSLLMRGVYGNIDERSIEEGGRFTEHGFASTSPTPSVAESYATKDKDRPTKETSTMFHLFGKSGANVSQESSNPALSQALFKSGVSFDIDIKQYDNKNRILKVVKHEINLPEGMKHGHSHTLDLSSSGGNASALGTFTQKSFAPIPTPTKTKLQPDEELKIQRQAAERLRKNLTVALSILTPRQLMQVYKHATPNPANKISAKLFKTILQSNSPAVKKAERKKQTFENNLGQTTSQRVVTVLEQHMPGAKKDDLRLKVMKELNPSYRLYPQIYDYKFHRVGKSSQLGEALFPFTAFQADVLIDGAYQKISTKITKPLAKKLLEYIDKELRRISTQHYAYDPDSKHNIVLSIPDRHRLVPMLDSFIEENRALIDTDAEKLQRRNQQGQLEVVTSMDLMRESLAKDIQALADPENHDINASPERMIALAKECGGRAGSKYDEKQLMSDLKDAMIPVTSTAGVDQLMHLVEGDLKQMILWNQHLEPMVALEKLRIISRQLKVLPDSEHDPSHPSLEMILSDLEAYQATLTPAMKEFTLATQLLTEHRRNDRSEDIELRLKNVLTGIPVNKVRDNLNRFSEKIAAELQTYPSFSDSNSPEGQRHKFLVDVQSFIKYFNANLDNVQLAQEGAPGWVTRNFWHGNESALHDIDDLIEKME